MSDRKFNEPLSDESRHSHKNALPAEKAQPFDWAQQSDLILEDLESEPLDDDLRLDPVPYQPELILVEDPDPDSPEENMRLDTVALFPNLSEADIRDLLIEEPSASSASEFESDEALPPPPAARRNPFAVLWGGFCSNLPRKEDTTGTKVRKGAFLFSLLVMLVAIIYLVVDLLIIPAKNQKLKEELIALYHPEKSQVTVTKEEAEKNNYPARMLASFADLYDRNDEVRGWISYHATGNKDFLDIEYPIVYSGDNTKYLKKDFDGNKNRNGTLFFDENNKVDSYKDQNRSLIVYGHNMASGQMFAGINKLYGSLSNARASATLTMSTLFREDAYKVFAVILTDESDKKQGRYFNTRRTSFADEEDFLDYVSEMKARSMFTYPVDVQENDQLLVLSTCTGKSSAHVKDGRLVVVARRVRDGEDPKVNTAQIVKNKEVIMPYYWYINQKKTPHEYYIHDLMDTNPTPNLGSGTYNPVVLPSVPTSSTVSGTTTSGTATGTSSTDATGGTSADGSSTTQATGSTVPGESQPTETTTGSTTTAGSSTSTGTQSSTSTGASTGASTTGSTTTTTATSAPTHTHTFSDCEDASCNGEGCDFTRPVPAHVYDNSCDKNCNVCDEPREIEHKYEVTATKDPTCKEYGEIQYTCQVCGNQYTEKDGEPTGEHTYDEDGVCTGCGAEKPAEPIEE